MSVGMKPGDIRSFDDFARLPLMTKDEHRQAQAESLERYGDPLRLLNCAPIEKVVRINSTSGTTGMPTLLRGDGARRGGDQRDARAQVLALRHSARPHHAAGAVA